MHTKTLLWREVWIFLGAIQSGENDEGFFKYILRVNFSNLEMFLQV